MLNDSLHSGIARTGEKLFASLVFADEELLAALRAGVLALDGLGAGLTAQGAGRLALGIFRAPQELAGLAELEHHGRVAEVADLVGRDLDPLHVRFGGLQLFLKRIVKLVEHLRHLFLGGSDVVELVFHLGRELEVEDLGKLLDQEVGHGHPQMGRVEAPLFLLDVAAILDCLDDRRVGAGAADRLFFQGLDQRGLAVARRRLREMLGRVEALASRARLPAVKIGKSSSSCLPPGGQTRRWPSNFCTFPWALNIPRRPRPRRR